MTTRGQGEHGGYRLVISFKGNFMNLLSARQSSGHCSRVTKWVCRFFFTLCLVATGSHAGEKESRRVWAGVDLFPSLLAADLDIENKRTPEGKLLLVLLYMDDKGAAEKMAQYLGEIKKIRDIPIQVEISNDITLKNYYDCPPAGVFLTQRIRQGLDSIIQYSKKNHILVFSPFEGDVKKGIPGGIMISDRILPYVNMKALRSSEIRMKKFFLRISEQYDQ